MNCSLLVLAVVFSVLSSVFTRMFADTNKDNEVNAFTYNLGLCVIWLFIFAPRVILIDELCITTSAMVFGIFYGILLFAFLYSRYRSVDEGPYAITQLINCPAFIVPTLVGVIFYEEGTSVNAVIGMILVCVSLCMCVNPKYSGEKLTAKWFIYSFIYFISNSLIGVVYKVFGGVSNGNDYDAMLLFAAVTAIILYIIFIATDNCKTKTKIKLPCAKKSVLMVLSGLFGCISIRLNLYLSNVVPSAIIFPVTNCAVVVVSTAIAMVAFKEKLSKVQFWGIGIGIIAIIITSL